MWVRDAAPTWRARGAGPAVRCPSPPGSATAFPAPPSCSSAASSTWSSPVCCGGQGQVRGHEKSEAYPLPKPFTPPHTLTQLAAVTRRRWRMGYSLPTHPLASQEGDAACPLPTSGCSAPSDQPPGLTGAHKEQHGRCEPFQSISGCCPSPRPEVPGAPQGTPCTAATVAPLQEGPHPGLSPHISHSLGDPLGMTAVSPGWPWHPQHPLIGSHVPPWLPWWTWGGDRRAESKIPVLRLPPSPGGTWRWGVEPSRPVPSH